MNPTITPITHRVTKWLDVETVTVGEGTTFRVGGHEFAHLSADGELTVPTSPAVRDQLLTDGFADRVRGRSDRVRYCVRSAADVPGAIRLLRIAYLHRHARAVPSSSRDDHLRRLGANTELVELLCHSGGEKQAV
jgi:hypothetical protein